MPGIFRRRTNLEHVESDPVAHSHLFRKPRTHDPVDEPVSHHGSGDQLEETDNPIREKRELLVVGIRLMTTNWIVF